ncbi:ribosome biogenesis GTP-binding protein YsxC/EngB [Campylobacter subantarcticus LMG 24377]|uniref:Probable GTP-binding protein EngB n=2 Tax=Campylobacter subantarcticus TaxID=497724 RepID=A0A0A8HA68_9BACT|nr:ribosome biogenesis GTP-binding protein YihA/YsxC [Campylobacter subantarcticus]EAJ1260622.1 YihA family ribosome biogenesis GTP-binding protein [Campylobacter lari]AJC90550.1 ribosome biogenesis GTP-binding protein YsxC/EngB [Campylobacter subantarcticus LMG 24374]AJC92310.1 ribosome biogenesis GTP-binding protein YsxC/EngB [Campylobacter subantarcticus LMG 24377]EAL3938533.1 YihA family ribosome biogenesis GTP-binding protein [Campylobacter lari]MPB99632.1 YihA family ribosome biogenesis 
MILNAQFLTSASKVSEAPQPIYTEIAFLGRSNVGKSSLINALCKNKNLAKSSSTPGKTQLINFFEVSCKKNEDKFKLMFIDLPGFGYAKVSKKTKAIWNKNLDEFLKERSSIKLFIHLVDSRHENLDIDANSEAYLDSFIRADQKKITVFTKSDKLNQSQKAKILNLHKNAIMVSNLKKIGIEKLEEKIILESLGLNEE